MNMKNILIVDDEEPICMVLSELFKDKNTIVLTCGSMNQAIDMLRHFKFDLVITDVRLNGRNGNEGLQILSHVKQVSPKTEVIVMTGYGTEEIEKDAYNRGALFFLKKPFDIRQLISKVKPLGIKTQFMQETILS